MTDGAAQTQRVYVHATAAIGPHLDAVADERRVLTQTPPKLDPTAALKALLGDPLRQASHLVKLAMLGAQHCRQRIRCTIHDDCAIYVGTGLGELEKTRTLFEQVMPPKNGFASPFDFINAAANMAAFYVAKSLGLSTRNLTLSDDEFSFEAALHLAWADIHHGSRQQVLAGGVDERYEDLESQLRRMTLAENQIVGEGSGWLFLSSEADGALGELLFVDSLKDSPAMPADWVKAVQSRAEERGMDCDRLTLLPGFRIDAGLQNQIAACWPGAGLRNYVSYCGAFHSASAFGCAQLFDDAAAPGDYLHIGMSTAGKAQLIGLRRH